MLKGARDLTEEERQKLEHELGNEVVLAPLLHEFLRTDQRLVSWLVLEDMTLVYNEHGGNQINVFAQQDAAPNFDELVARYLNSEAPFWRFAGIANHLAPSLREAIHRDNRYEIVVDESYLTVRIGRADFFSRPPPTSSALSSEGGPLELDWLRASDVDLVNDNWFARGPFSRGMVAQCVAKNGGSCLRLKGEDRAIGWCLGRVDGSIGLLHVDPEWRGKGLAKCLMHKLASKLLMEDDRRLEQFGFIADDNEASLKVHRDLGYRVVERNVGLTWWFSCKKKE